MTGTTGARSEPAAPKDGGRLGDNGKLLVAVAAVLALVFAFVASNVAANHAPKPHDMPVGVVGTPSVVQATAAQLESSAPGAYEVTAYDSSAVAETGILHRSVYGAYVPSSQPTLLVATAASGAAASVLKETFKKAAKSQGQKLKVEDVAPLPPSDSSGATSFSAILSLIICGILGTGVIYAVTQHRSIWLRLAALVALAIGAGLLTALSTNVIVGAFSGNFFAIWGVATLFVLAIAMPIAAFQVLLGLPGTAVGLLVFVVVGDPSSGGSTAPELLPGFWRAVSQHLPPGAGVTSMRSVVYFDGHGGSRALIVLGVYAVVGAAAAIVISIIRARPRPALAPA